MRKRILIFIAALVAINISMTFIPAGVSIKLDGVISNGEWENAKENPLAGGGKLMMQREASVLFMALVADKKSWAPVYLGSGDTVRVLHSSAALGEANLCEKG